MSERYSNLFWGRPHPFEQKVSFQQEIENTPEIALSTKSPPQNDYKQFFQNRRCFSYGLSTMSRYPCAVRKHGRTPPNAKHRHPAKSKRGCRHGTDPVGLVFGPAPARAELDASQAALCYSAIDRATTRMGTPRDVMLAISLTETGKKLVAMSNPGPGR